jgi:hypothetical protein
VPLEYAVVAGQPDWQLILECVGTSAFVRQLPLRSLAVGLLEYVCVEAGLCVPMMRGGRFRLAELQFEVTFVVSGDGNRGSNCRTSDIPAGYCACRPAAWSLVVPGSLRYVSLDRVTAHTRDISLYMSRAATGEPHPIVVIRHV